MIKNKKRLIINIMAIFLVVFLIRIYIDNNVFEISYIDFVDLEIPNSFNNIKILQISDLHNKSYGKENVTLLKAIDKITPDYIFLTGDMLSSKDTDFSTFYNLVSKIGPKYECYYIVGNHELDFSNEQLENLYATLESYEIKVLDNEKVELLKGNEKINLYGMWYNPKYYMQEDFKLDIMEKIMKKAEENAFNILLTHNPDDFEIYANWGADLTFSGHVHGGMIRIPFIGGIISPDRTLLPEYDAGIYEYDDSNLIVSRGMSRGATGIRIFNQPELVVVNLKSMQ